MTHQILSTLPFKRVVSQNTFNEEEIFDLYACGNFNNGLTTENVEIVALPPHAHYQLHFHKQSAAIIYIISGTGFFQLDEKIIAYKPQMRIEVPTYVMHGFKTQSSTLFLSIQTPSIIDSDTGKIDLHYNFGSAHNE
jgi:quercetin dioxygenase-like cupin family protein